MTKLILSENTKNLFSNNLKDCKCRHCVGSEAYQIKFAVVIVCIPKVQNKDLYCDFYCKDHFKDLFDSYDKYDLLIEVDLSNFDPDSIIKEYNKFKKLILLQ